MAQERAPPAAPAVAVRRALRDDRVGPPPAVRARARAEVDHRLPQLHEAGGERPAHSWAGRAAGAGAHRQRG
eukprot:5366493-Alexandrium_andersonii.AAC.1